MKKHFTNSYWWESRFKAKIGQRSLWKKRNEFAHALEMEGYQVTEYDNCWRLSTYTKGNSRRECHIDCEYRKGWFTSAISNYREENDEFDDIIYEVYGYYSNGSKFPSRDKDKYVWNGHEWIYIGDEHEPPINEPETK